MTIIRANNRFLRTAPLGRLLQATPGADGGGGEPPVGPSNTTSLTLHDFVVNHADAMYIAQRKAGTENNADGGHADVELEYEFVGDAPTVQARVLEKANTANVIKDWTTLTNPSVVGLVGYGTLPGVPAGGKYLVEIRDAFNTSLSSLGTKAWGVGVIGIYWGQSNMLTTMLAGAGGTDIVPGTGMTEWNYIRSSDVLISLFDTASGWAFPTSFASTGRFITMRMMAKALEAKHGKKIPVGLVLWAFDSSSIASYLPGTSANSARRAMLTNSGVTGSYGFSSPRRVWSGDAEFVMGHQGEGDNLTPGLPNSYETSLIAFFDMMVGYFAAKGRTHQSLGFMPAVLGTFLTGISNVERLRQAVLNFEQHAKNNNWTHVKPGWTTLDCKGPSNNTLHFEQPDNKSRSVRRMIQSILNKIDPVRAPNNSSGPRLVGTATRVGDTITLPVVNGETLAPLTAGADVTGWYGNTLADFSGTNVELSNVRPGTGVVLVDAINAPAEFFIKHCGGLIGVASGPSSNSDVSNLLYRRTPYPQFNNNAGNNIFTGTDLRDDMPLFPTPTAIRVLS